MSVLPAMKTVTCGEGRTKQKVGVEHDINKIVARFKKTGEMPRLLTTGREIMEDGVIVDLTEVGDFQECQNRIVAAQELFDRYPSKIRREFDNSTKKFMDFMSNLKEPGNMEKALAMGLVEKVPAPADKPKEEKDVQAKGEQK